MKKIFFAFIITLIYLNEAQAQWETVFTCDNNAVVVDRNSHNSRYAQVVIKNREIVKYISSVVDLFPNNNGEIILIGANDVGINSPGDFHGFRTAATEPPNDMNRLDWVARNGNALSISFNRRIIPNNSDCGRDIPSSDPYCSGKMNEVANWVFKNCK